MKLPQFRKQQPPQSAPTAEQCLRVFVKFKREKMGSDLEGELVHSLGVALSEALRPIPGAQFDDDEFGEGFGVLYMYGPSADALYHAALPALLSFRLPSGSYLVRRYGPPGARQGLEHLGTGRTAH